MKRIFLFSITMLYSCAPSGTTNTFTEVNDASSSLAARFVFHKDNFTHLSNFVAPVSTNYSCLGDVHQVFYASGDDYTGTPTAFAVSNSSDALLPTEKPAFIRHVSVDITQTYFPYSQSGLLQTDACSYRSTANSTEPAPCADFDVTPPAAPAPTVAPTSTPVTSPTATPTSTPYYDSNFYRVRDDWCVSQGPLISVDEDTTKTYVGGVNIDLDRTELGSHEDLLMNITYQALNANAAWPSAQGAKDETILEVNLVGTGLSLDLLMGQRQPRVWSDYSNTQMPIYHRSIATLQDPYSSLRTVQVYLPISANSLIDRVRIERVRGSYFLYQIDLYRLGDRTE